MRLIDADKLKKHIRIWNYNSTTSAPTFRFITEEDIDECPTVCDIEQIRAEIAELRDSEQHGNTVTLYCWDTMKDRVLQIIDRHTKGDKE